MASFSVFDRFVIVNRSLLRAKTKEIIFVLYRAVFVKFVVCLLFFAADNHRIQDQEKINSQQKSLREQEQERQWKQLQAMRARDQQMQHLVIHDQKLQQGTYRDEKRKTSIL